MKFVFCMSLIVTQYMDLLIFFKTGCTVYYQCRVSSLLISALFFKSTQQEGDEQGMEDAKEVVPGKAYHWRDWCVARGRDCLYIWSDAAALELSNGSNGWFRFILDGKLATMYSSGSPEGGSESTGITLLLKEFLTFKILVLFFFFFFFFFLSN